MADCTNEAMRDLLPLLAHEGAGGEDAAELRAARAHVDACASCRAELAMLRAAGDLIERAVPRVDAARIAAGVVAATRVRLVSAPPATAVRRVAPRMPSRWMPRRQAAIAASLVLVASASLAVVARTFGGPDRATLDGARGTAVVDTSPVSRVSASAGISVAGGLSDLSDDQLVTLLAELDAVEATVAAEPQSIRQPIVDVPEEF